MAAKIAAGVVVGLLALLALSQIFIPPIVAGQAENRLEEDGGNANVKVSGFPAVALLWGSGSKFEARGEGLKFKLGDRRKDPLGELADYDKVDIRFTDLDAGLVKIRTFGLERPDSASSFYLRLDANTTPAEIARQAGERAGGQLGNLLGGLAGDILPNNGEQEIPVEVEGELSRTSRGQIDIDGVDANVAGIPAGPFAETIVQAVLNRL